VFGFTKQSGGDVLVTSEEGKGATFAMYLPASANDITADAGEQASKPGDTLGRGACILVVEDNPDVGNFATQALAELGYCTELAVDGAGALERLAAGHAAFDVVFSDVVMPGMSGVELGKEIRRLYPDLPVILASGYSSVIAESGTHGFELLHKPYSIDALSRILRQVSDTRRR
jgi:DNA-binding NtrC family response regulator